MTQAAPGGFRPVSEIERPHYVKTDERVVWQGKPVLRSVASNLGGLITGVAFLLFGTSVGFIADRPLIFGGIALFVAVTALVLPLLGLRRMQFVVTDAGAYARSGIFGERVNQTSFEKITDISYNQDIAGRVFGYGRLSVNTAGSTGQALTMVGLTDALLVKRILEQAKGQRTGRRGRFAPVDVANGPGRVFVPRALVERVRCPNCAQVTKRRREAAAGPGACPNCHRRVIFVGADARG